MSKEIKENSVQNAKESVVFLFYQDGKILLEQRTKRPADLYSGLLVFPGGKVEASDIHPNGNRFLTALFRETNEEFSVNPATIILLLRETSNVAPNGDAFNTQVYLITDWEGEINLCKEPEKAIAVWVNIDEAASLMPLEFSKEIIAAAIKSLPHPT